MYSKLPWHVKKISANEVWLIYSKAAQLTYKVYTEAALDPHFDDSKGRWDPYQSQSAHDSDLMFGSERPENDTNQMSDERTWKRDHFHGSESNFNQLFSYFFNKVVPKQTRGATVIGSGKLENKM